MLAAATATLRKLGLTSIDQVDSGAAAVGALRETRYDVVLLDWYMPDMNGAALLQVVRDPRFRRERGGPGDHGDRLSQPRDLRPGAATGKQQR